MKRGFVVLSFVVLACACARSEPKQPTWFDAYMQCRGGCSNRCALHESETFVLCDSLCDRTCKDRHWPNIGDFASDAAAP